MKNKYSFIACCIISLMLFQYRLSYSGYRSEKPLVITTYDALGYYMYLPAMFIYHDLTDLKWFPEIDKKYSVSGGWLYQAHKFKNDKYVFKYFGGIAILETPFFFIGHGLAIWFRYDTDGFSAPYQYALGFGIVFYCILAIFLLRKILLRYFSDATTVITLFLLILSTNFIQYASIDTALSHGPLFLLYVLIIFATIKWHEKPNIFWACAIGYIIGLATICRPTEVIMFLIPLLWNTQTKELAKEKWQLVKQYRNHLAYSLVFVLLGILPQLIYWKIASGSFVYDVGSKWSFLNPFFRVLFGFEKGWFIYTPVTIFFIVGMFFMKTYPFKKSVIWFCALNIWMVISWYDWRYGASYSSRALVQSYPVFALPFAALIEHVSKFRWRYSFYALGLYLIFVNLFQIKQYNSGVLHYNDMNRKYYNQIYLNNNPTPLDMSLLDNDEFVKNEKDFKQEVLFQSDSIQNVKSLPDSIKLVREIILNDSTNHSISWIKVEAAIKVTKGFYQGYLESSLQNGDSTKFNRVRLFNAISHDQLSNDYAYYIEIPEYFKNGKLKLYLRSKDDFEGSVENLKLTNLFN